MRKMHKSTFFDLCILSTPKGDFVPEPQKSPLGQYLFGGGDDRNGTVRNEYVAA